MRANIAVVVDGGSLVEAAIAALAALMSPRALVTSSDIHPPLARVSCGSMVIKLVKVPKELYEQARYTDHLCEHLYQKVAGGAKIQDQEIGSIGSHRHRNDDYKAALCLNCGYAYIERRFTGFEVVKDTPPVPINEMPLFKDVMKK